MVVWDTHLPNGCVGHSASQRLLWSSSFPMNVTGRQAEVQSGSASITRQSARSFVSLIAGLPTLRQSCCPGNTSVASRSPRLHYCHLNDIERHWVVLGRYLGIRLDGRLALQWWPLTRLCSAFSRSVRVPSQTGCLSVLAPSLRTLSYVGWATAEMGLHDSCPRSSSGRTKRLTTW